MATKFFLLTTLVLFAFLAIRPSNGAVLKTVEDETEPPEDKRVLVGEVGPRAPKVPYDYTKNEQGEWNTWHYSSNGKMQVLVNDMVSRMQQMVKELKTKPHKYDEWTELKKLFKQPRRDDTNIIQFGEKPDDDWDKERPKIRTKVVRQLARRSGYFIKEENLHLKMDPNSSVYKKLFAHEPKGEYDVNDKVFQTKEYKALADKWKKLNTSQVWVLLWNLFAAVGDSKVNVTWSLKSFHELHKSMDSVAQALKEHFKHEKGSKFKGKDPWTLNTEGVVFGTEKDYQAKWGLLSFPAKVIKSLSGEMKEEEHLALALEQIAAEPEKAEEKKSKD